MVLAGEFKKLWCLKILGIHGGDLQFEIPGGAGNYKFNLVPLEFVPRG